jgi:Mrp family chromosome partitioning ATPase
VHEVFSEALGQGLSEMLSAGLDPLQVLRKTREPNLSFISAGQENVDSVELLASHKMERLLDELRTGFQIVLVDTPPAGVVADALGMAPLLDGVVLVVRRDHAPGRVVVEAVQRLRQAEARVIGTVFNASPPNRDALRYGKGYYTEARPQGRRQPG